jgi:hypothetical protein
MKWSDILPVLGKLAPTIAAAAGGPLAGTAVSAIEGVFGLNKGTADLTTRQDDVAAAIAGATPDQLLALKKADNDFLVQMQELEFKDAEAIAALNVQDRSSARSREVSTKDLTPRFLAGGVTLGFFTVLLYMLTHDVPATTQTTLNLMLGSLGTAWIGIINYYFGSSSGSAAKTALLAKSTPAQ